MSWTLPSQVIEWDSAGSSMNAKHLFIVGRGRKFILAFLDLYLVFYVADHGILLILLRIAARVYRKALRWFQSFPLTSKYSCSAPFRTLILQDSVPIPRLFNICMKQLGEIVRWYGLKCQTIPKTTLVSTWTKDSWLKLNSRKTQVVLMKRGNLFEELAIST